MKEKKMNNITLAGKICNNTMNSKKVQGSNGEFEILSFAITVFREKKGDTYINDFINCRAFGKTAESIQKFFQPGQVIGITGKLHVDEYESNGENKKYSYVKVDNFTFLPRGDAPKEQTIQNAKKDLLNVNGFDINEDDLPF